MTPAVEMDPSPDQPRSTGRGQSLAGLLGPTPAPLAAILVVVVLVGVSWAILVPPWQTPDETTQFAYAQSLAERFALPGDKHRPSYSTDQLLADYAVGASVMALRPDQIKLDWSRTDYATYRAEASRDPARSNGGGPNPASSNPPLYYLYADLAYWLTYGGNTFDRLYAMRVWGVGLLALTVVASWLLAGEVLGRRRLPQLTCAAVAGLLPMETFMSTSVNPDALMVPLWTLALWLGARVIARGGQPRDTVAMCGVTAAAILTKATSYALLLPVLWALVIGWRGARAHQPTSHGRPVALAIFILVAPVLGWIGLSKALGRPALNTIQAAPGAASRPFNIGQFVSYLWQFYLPRLPFQTPFRITSGLPAYVIWIRGGWGTFGWLDVPMAGWLYHVLAGLTAAVAVTGVAILSRFRDQLRLELLAFFALALLGLLFGLHLTDYRSIIAGRGAILQGRYVLPVVALFGLAPAMIVSRLRPTWKGPATGMLLSGLLVLQLLALSTVARGYYT